MKLLGVACAIDRAKALLNLEFALKKQFACIQNITGGCDMIGILPTGYGKTLINTILPRVHDKHLGWHMVLVMLPDDGNSQNMHLRPLSLLGAFTKPNESRISKIVNMLVFFPYKYSDRTCRCFIEFNSFPRPPVLWLVVSALFLGFSRFQ